MPIDATQRVMIIGLDGATLDLIRPWAEAGILPTFQKLLRGGTWGTLRSTLPPLTPAAWSSFITGMNPGNHGLFDFTFRKRDSYDTAVVESSLRQAPSLWQLASRAGKRVIVYNVPVTYPPERVNGVMVSGLLTPDGAKDATYPPELQQELERAVPGLVFSSHELFTPGREAEFVHEQLETHEKNYQAVRYLMAREPWELLVMVFQHTDTMGHFMWKHMEDKGAGLPESVRALAADAMQACYRDMDAKVGKLIEAAGEGTQVIIMSDHGHGSLKYYFAVNNWLLDKGYIQLKRDALTQIKYHLFRLGLTPDLAYRIVLRLGIKPKIGASDLPAKKPARAWLRQLFLSWSDIDWSRTRAYSLGSYGPIFVNVKGREAEGIVAPGAEYEAVLDSLIKDLSQVKEPDTGATLFNEFHRGHQIYWGPYSDRGPDLLFFPGNWIYNAAGRREFEENRFLMPVGDNTGRSHSLIQTRVPYSGTHRMEGIVMMRGAGIREGFEIKGATVTDIAPTVLALLGIGVPEAMDGRVLEEAMTPELRERLAVSYAGEEMSAPELMPVADMSPEDEGILVARLRNLGYVD